MRERTVRICEPKKGSVGRGEELESLKPCYRRHIVKKSIGTKGSFQREADAGRTRQGGRRAAISTGVLGAKDKIREEVSITSEKRRRGWIQRVSAGPRLSRVGRN